jgi:subtilisin family serine protease
MSIIPMIRKKRCTELVEVEKGKRKKEKGKIFFLVFCLMVFNQVVAFSQDEPKSYYWVALKDKVGTAYQIDHPEAFLSQRAIDRRNRQHIAIDETDLPVSKVYLDSLKNLGLEIFHTSKWLNGATVRTSDTALIQRISSLSFVDSVQFTRPENVLKSSQSKFQDETISTEYNPADYSTALAQLTQLNGQFLHEQGFRGKGIQIAILDAGFLHANEFAAFDSLRSTNRILGTRDFVNPKSDIFQEHWHGMSVLSCMGANIPGSIIGTAPDASYYLFRTEQDPGEYITEEDNWIAGAELADSLGVDVINSSLGYTTFDDPKMSHAYSDMNGETTRAAKGANLAFQKGILIFCSAGNEGNHAWLHIVTPSDSKNVLAVGAVDINGSWAYFSSVGPASGGAIKPNVSARGLSTYLITASGSPGYASGTSFSSPVLAGMGACLLQANPYANAVQLKMAIEQSGNQFSTPDSLLGYGIPDFEKADQYLKANYSSETEIERNWMVFPNPFRSEIVLRNQNFTSGDDCHLSIFNIQGVCLWQSNFKSDQRIVLKNLSFLPEGLYILNIRSGGKEERIKLIKKTQ